MQDLEELYYSSVSNLVLTSNSMRQNTLEYGHSRSYLHQKVLSFGINFTLLFLPNYHAAALNAALSVHQTCFQRRKSSEFSPQNRHQVIFVTQGGSDS